MSNMISAHSLRKSFGHVQAVNGISLSVSKGEVLGFLGPNGAGKSTTMRMLSGFLTPDSGTASICGFDVTSNPIEAKKAMGYLPEGAPAYSNMTPKNFLEFVGGIRGLSGKSLKQAVERTIEQTHIESVVYRSIETLSKGYKRRVGLAQTLVHDPKVLILDEPTDGLDPNQKHEIRKLIRKMASEKAIIISTHILEEVESVCTRAVIIADGRLVMDGTPKEMIAFDASHNAVLIPVKMNRIEDAKKDIQIVKSVERWEVLEENLTFDGQPVVLMKLYPINKTDISRNVYELISPRDWVAGPISTLRGRLDTVFRDVTGSMAS